MLIHSSQKDLVCQWLQIEISSECFQSLKDKRRNLLGRTGCGLCGAENLDQALRLPKKTIDRIVEIKESLITASLEKISLNQSLQKKQALHMHVHGLI
ncbi:MAG: hypothetical protein EXR41_03270 [Candidatus Methylopumilus sp.]|nr:hypothetical protein [Candidatus Methylopumilus sp.]